MQDVELASEPDPVAVRAPDRRYADEGRIPFRVRIGVTGHRALADEEAVAAAVATALREIRAAFTEASVTPICFTILSALAEGADRLVVREAFAVLGDDVRVEAVLPRDADDYKQDFASAASRREFDELLAHASARSVPVIGSATEGYERAGRYVVDQSDVLVAVWDRAPARGRAGTAEIVAYARDRKRPVVVVDASAPSEPDSPGLEHLPAALRRLERYNAGSLRSAALRRALAEQRSRLAVRVEGSPIREDVERAAAWALPRFVRAEVQALRFQRAYYALGDMLYVLAALAVTAVAAQSVFAPEHTKLVAVEIVFLLLVIAVFLTARFGHMHERWMGYRSLAEAFRSALFILLTGAHGRSDGEGTAELPVQREPWYQRAFSESWSRRPPADRAIEDSAALRAFVMDAWLGDQIDYHRRKARFCSVRHHRVSLTVAALATAALTVAAAHFFDVGEGTDWPRWFTFLAIALPGFGAAVTGIREHRQYRLHGQRSARTADRLQRLRDQIETGARRVPVQGLAAEIQTIILQESVEWFGVQEFQELEMVM